jgi:hypothetical protein
MPKRRQKRKGRSEEKWRAGGHLLVPGEDGSEGERPPPARQFFAGTSPQDLTHRSN